MKKSELNMAAKKILEDEHDQTGMGFFQRIAAQHESTMKAFKKLTSKGNDYSELLNLNRVQWEEIVKDEIKDIPVEITGDTKEERITKYAAQLHLAVEQRFPGDLMNFRLTRGKKSKNNNS